MRQRDLLKVWRRRTAVPHKLILEKRKALLVPALLVLLVLPLLAPPPCRLVNLALVLAPLVFRA